jgi:hypothetical protein
MIYQSCRACGAANLVFLGVRVVDICVYWFVVCMCECVVFVVSLFVSGVRACEVCICVG